MTTFIMRSALIVLLLLAGCASTQHARQHDDRSDLAQSEREVSPVIAHERGLAFLLEHQNPDGTWGTFESARPYEIYKGTVASFRAFRDATTALCVMALIEPSRNDEAAWQALGRGAEHLLVSEPVGRATPDTFYDTWSLTYSLRALNWLYQDDRFVDRRDEIAAGIQRTIDAIAMRQGADGGWGYYDFGQTLATPSGLMSNSFNTASIIIGLEEAADLGFEVESAVVRDALRCLERLRLPSGAFVYGTGHRHMPVAFFNRTKGSLARSQPCNLALWIKDREISKAQIQQSLDELREHHHFLRIAYGRPRPHEAWYQNSGYYFFYGHFYASHVAHVLDDAEAGDFLNWQSQMIADLQNEDGSWYDFPMYGYHRAYGTAYALLILQSAQRDGVRPAVAQKGLHDET